MENVEIKACAHCSGEAKLVESDLGVQVFCLVCHATSHTRHPASDAMKALVIDAWNRRDIPSPDWSDEEILEAAKNAGFFNDASLATEFPNGWKEAERRIIQCVRSLPKQSSAIESLQAKVAEMEKDAKRGEFVARNWHSMMEGMPLHQWVGENALKLGGVASAIDFAVMIERGTKAWKDVPDNWLEDLRGNIPNPE